MGSEMRKQRGLGWRHQNLQLDPLMRKMNTTFSHQSLNYRVINVRRAIRTGGPVVHYSVSLCNDHYARCLCERRDERLIRDVRGY